VNEQVAEVPERTRNVYRDNAYNPTISLCEMQAVVRSRAEAQEYERVGLMLTGKELESIGQICID
jgi:hypothetical protein